MRAVQWGTGLSLVWLCCCLPDVRPVHAVGESSSSVSGPKSAEEGAPASPRAPSVSGSGVGLNADGGEVELPGNSSAPDTSRASGVSSAAPVLRPLPQLGPFYDALDALRGGGGLPVRVLWLGDSHTAADFMTAPVRRRLQAVGGDGGPGFVRLGFDHYRHDRVSLKKSGKWRRAPILPAQRTRVLDGVFGYAGIRTLPAAGAEATATVRGPADASGLTFTLMTRLAPGAAVKVEVAGRTIVQRSGEGEDRGGIAWRAYEAPEGGPFSLWHHSGDPEVFGLFVDSGRPGAVLDTVGIDGARVATPLAWEPEQFEAQVGARAPRLLVLAFGTNEVFDQTAVSRYREHYLELVGRAKAVSPDLPCWIVGPPDASGRGEASRPRVLPITELQREVAQELGCAFSSAYELMGGAGSFKAWARAHPPKARGDGIHFTILGYDVLGSLLADALLGETTVINDAESPQPI